MKKVLKFFGVALAFIIGAFALVSCSTTDTPASGGSGTSGGSSEGSSGGSSGGSSQVATQYLTFITNGKVRVDILDENLGCTFNYGNEAVVSGREMTYAAANKLAHNGTITVEKLNFIIIIEDETGTAFGVSQGIEKDSIEEFLANRTYNNAKKIYIAISTGDLKWTKGLNADMDAKINSYILV